MKRLAVMALCIFASGAEALTPAPDAAVVSYRKGVFDRDSWNSWYDNLKGVTREGAEYYVSWRNTPGQVLSCEVMSGGDSRFRTGCVTAREFFKPIDALRQSDADYWRGWRGEQALTYGYPGHTTPHTAASGAYASGLPYDYSTPSGAAASCADQVRQTAGFFDSYYDASTNTFNSIGTDFARMEWQQCLIRHGAVAR